MIAHAEVLNCPHRYLAAETADRGQGRAHAILYLVFGSVSTIDEIGSILD